MTKTQIFSYLMFIPVVILGYLLYDGIAGTIIREQQIRDSEALVRDKLILVRAAEKAYLSQKGKYTADWDSLAIFLKTDSIYITEETEIYSMRTPDDPDFYTLGAEKVEIQVDTIEVITAMQAVRNELPEENLFLKNINPDRLAFIPGKDEKKFDIFVDKIEKSGVMIDVIEVVNRFPEDKSRDDDNENPRRRFLRFGSRTEVTTAGNWE